MASARQTVVALVAAALTAACGADHALECKDLLPAGSVSFRDVTARVIEGGSKSCALCHNTATPIYGYNFELPGVAYDALTNHMAPIYRQLASGRMPKDGTRWTEDDLRVLRTWYCDGAFYEN